MIIKTKKRNKKQNRTVEFKGNTYKVRSDKIDIPDFSYMSGIDAALWLIENTYPKGYSKSNPLAGWAGIINVTVNS